MAAAATPRPSLIYPRASSHSQPSAVGLTSRRRCGDFQPVRLICTGANGRTGKQWKQLPPLLRTRLADQCNICECITSGPSHAIDVTREAIKDGADAVIAVGGDGTLHEVVNGFFWKGSPVRALDRGPDHSAALGCFASMYKRFGNLCYVFGPLRAFWGHNNQDMRIKVNGGEWRTVHKITAPCIGNAKYFGGGMKITPTANPFSDNLEVVMLQDFKWYDFLLKLHGLYGGTHLLVNGVSSMRVQSIEVAEVNASGGIFV